MGKTSAVPLRFPIISKSAHWLLRYDGDGITVWYYCTTVRNGRKDRVYDRICQREDGKVASDDIGMTWREGRGLRPVVVKQNAIKLRRGSIPVKYHLNFARRIQARICSQDPASCVARLRNIVSGFIHRFYTTLRLSLSPPPPFRTGLALYFRRNYALELISHSREQALFVSLFG